MSGLPGYDAWKTSGRYSSCPMVVFCKCGESTPVVAETEYGCTTWSPEECSSCGEEFTGEEDWTVDEGPEPEYDPSERYDY